jgi:pyrroline-5-carboxylate reductase
MNIGFIGFGRIAKALAQGLAANQAYTMKAASPSLTLEMNPQGIQTFPDNASALSNTDIVILAVKPIKMSAVLTEIRPLLHPKQVLVSVATGLSMDWLNQHCPDQAIVRAMPNIAAALGQSATPLIANAQVTEEQKKNVAQVFQCLGLITWITQESQMNAYTALSGSGPAYVFLFMDSMIKAAISLGIAEDIAHLFALQTFQGALSLATENKTTLDDLIKQVTSPAGTTAAALGVFMHHDLKSIIQEAMAAANKRAIELSLI